MDEKNIAKKYLVVMDGCCSYGSEIYFVGIFSTTEEAQNAVQKCLEYAKEEKVNVDEGCYKVFEVDEGWWHYPHSCNFPYDGGAKTDIYLGGYVE